jgi:hypothetical protein
VPLDREQIALLDTAIANYGFPAVYFNFSDDSPQHATCMVDVELALYEMLTSKSAQDVAYGLANVIYWGYAQIGFRDTRVKRFLSGVTANQITQFQSLMGRIKAPTLSDIGSLKMPEYSGISFISKVLAFLNPVEYCVLDKQLAKIGHLAGDRSLHRLRAGTSIPVSGRNEAAYDDWRQECKDISTQYFDGKYRTVDVERGFFQLVQTNNLVAAQHIYAAA